MVPRNTTTTVDAVGERHSIHTERREENEAGVALGFSTRGGVSSYN